MMQEIKLKDGRVTHLRAYACYEVMRAENDWKDSDFKNELTKGSGLESKWRRRVHSPSLLWIGRFADRSPFVQKIYELPLWLLLSDNRLSSKKVADTVTQFRLPRQLLPYNFPNDPYLSRPEREPLPVAILQDSQRLLARGDVYGFMGIAGLVREAEAAGDWDFHASFLSDLIRSLPAVGRSVLFRQDFDLLCEVAKQMHERVPTAVAKLTINWHIIHGQQEDADFEPCREFRIIDSSTRRFQDVADPVRLHGGFDVGTPIKKETVTTARLRPSSADELEAMGRGLELIAQLIQLVQRWKLDRHSWEPLLGTDSQRVNEVLYGPASPLRIGVEERIQTLIAIHELLNLHHMDDSDQIQFITSPQPRLFDRSILQACSEGDHLGALETTRVVTQKLPLPGIDL